jgi:hypothetical protein
LLKCLQLVEALLAVISEPRALVGRARNGSAVVLGRCEQEISPYFPGVDRAGRFELITKPGGVRFVILCRSEGATLDVDAYSWPKGRSPLDVPRDSLAMLFDDIAQAVVEEALKTAVTAPTAEDIERQRASEARLAKIRDEIAAGLHTPESIAAREDEELAASMPLDISWRDGPRAANVLAARDRIAHRQRLASVA